MPGISEKIKGVENLWIADKGPVNLKQLIYLLSFTELGRCQIWPCPSHYAYAAQGQEINRDL